MSFHPQLPPSCSLGGTAPTKARRVCNCKLSQLDIAVRGRWFTPRDGVVCRTRCLGDARGLRCLGHAVCRYWQAKRSRPRSRPRRHGRLRDKTSRDLAGCPRWWVDPQVGRGDARISADPLDIGERKRPTSCVNGFNLERWFESSREVRMFARLRHRTGRAMEFRRPLFG